jgi:predicted acyl esterase
MTPNKVTPLTIDLHTANHVLERGHRIMVQAPSTWFPLYDSGTIRPKWPGQSLVSCLNFVKFTK